MSKHGTVHWSELMTRDVEATKAYYSAMCGWTFSEMPMPDGLYYLGMKDDMPIVGLFGMEGTEFDGYDTQWVTYFAVDDVDAAVQHTRDTGGEVTKDAFEVPGIGRIAMIKDPGGAHLGIMTPANNG